MSGVEELVFTLVVSGPSLEGFCWDALANVPVEASFPRLQTARFFVEGFYPMDGRLWFDECEVVELIRCKLPTWAALSVFATCSV